MKMKKMIVGGLYHFQKHCSTSVFQSFDDAMKYHRSSPVRGDEIIFFVCPTDHFLLLEEVKTGEVYFLKVLAHSGDKCFVGWIGPVRLWDHFPNITAEE